MIFSDFQGSAGQKVNGYKTIAVGPTRRLVSWIFMIFMDLLARKLMGIRP